MRFYILIFLMEYRPDVQISLQVPEAGFHFPGKIVNILYLILCKLIFWTLPEELHF